jgi:hypothetical protein
MSRCVICGSKGSCDEFCGLSFSEMRDSVIEAREEIEKLQAENYELHLKLAFAAEAQSQLKLLLGFNGGASHEAKIKELQDKLNFVEKAYSNFRVVCDAESDRDGAIIKDLQRKLDLAIEALEFYEPDFKYRDSYFDPDIKIFDDNGKCARQVLAQIRGEE